MHLRINISSSANWSRDSRSSRDLRSSGFTLFHAGRLQNCQRRYPGRQARQKIEPVACFYGAMPTGVTVSPDGRIFVNFPRWGDKVDFTVAEIKSGESLPFPNPEINRPDLQRPAESLISVQSVVVDPKNRLWMLDTGRIEWGLPPQGGPENWCA